ncbi:MAG TPA: helix-turn-helix transcriptional regulator [Aggregatilinea sp.]|uniref:helix-turn-helix domain-containing protein n=1 Tax=Aggregatilinea sp. TaxID=2806333 RepID=UPI002BCC6069|nr:helix-turn-helix transcriptional regulator [Aggregatilinea sp.]HML23375.1 helix-turn-helix transcriptional regulator [Aggregatilinea sp.]
MARVKNRFTELLERKRRVENKSWTYREIQEEIGLTPATLSRFAQQKHDQFDATTLATLCNFLGCTVGDLLYIEDESKGQRVGEATAVA